MRPITTTLAFATADDNGIAQSQLPVTTVAMTLNGAYASGGVATLPAPAHVTIASTDDLSSTTFTMAGFALDNTPLTEDLAGPNNTTTTGALLFKRVTSIIPVGGSYTTERAIAGAADAGLGNGTWWPLDIYTPNQVTTISVNLLGNSTGNYSVQYTNEDPFDTTLTQLAVAHPTAALTSATTDQTASVTVLMRAVRVNLASGAGTALVNLVQQSTR